MSCESNCAAQSAFVVQLLMGPPGYKGAQGDQGPQGPPGSLTSVHGDLQLTTDQQGSLATVTGIQGVHVSTLTPQLNQALVYDGGQWRAQSLSAGTY